MAQIARNPGEVRMPAGIEDTIHTGDLEMVAQKMTFQDSVKEAGAAGTRT